MKVWKALSTGRVSLRSVLLLHFALAFGFFSPFFLRGHLLLPGMDWFDFNYPVLVQAHHAFRSGSLSLWNPYLLCGTPAASVAYFPLFSPENWLLFSLPEALLPMGMTLLAFAKLWLLGLLAFWIFQNEIADRRWALLTSVCYQLCGYTVWSLVSDGLSLFFYFTLVLALIWSLEGKSRLRFFVALSVAWYCLITCSDLIHEAYAISCVLLCAIHRILRHEDRKETLASGRVLTLSLFTAILVAAPLWLPSLAEFGQSSRLDQVNPGFQDLSFLFGRLFNPELFGVSYRSSSVVISGISAVLRNAGVQIYSHMPHYFGVLQVLVVGAALPNLLREKQTRFWGVYLLAALALILGVEPASSLFQLAVHPFFHRFALQIVLPIGFCMALAHSLAGLPKRLSDSREADLLVGRLFWFAGLAVLYMLSVWALLLQFRLGISLVVKLACLGGTALLALRKGLLETVGWLNLVLIPTALVLAAVLALGEGGAWFHVVHFRLLAASVFLLLTLLLYCAEAFPSRPVHRLRAGLVAIALGIYLVVVYYPWLRALVARPPMQDVFFLSLLGFLRFALVTGIVGLALRRVRQGAWSIEALFPLFLAVVIGDGLAAAKIGGDIVLNPFSPPSAINAAPARLLSGSLDLADYRIGSPNLASGVPVYREVYGARETLSSLFMAYGFRSYGGFVNLVSRRYERLFRGLTSAKTLGPDNLLAHGFVADRGEERALDLFGVGYQYVPASGVFRDRTATALSRFEFFDRFEVIPSEPAARGRLQQASFDPQRVVTLDRFPGFSSSPGPGAARKVSATVVTSDRLLVDLLAPGQGILLFNDSFHEGWKAYVDGMERPILVANTGFMGLALSGGEHHVEFRFEPVAFHWGVMAAIAGGLLFLCYSFAELRHALSRRRLVLRPQAA